MTAHQSCNVQNFIVIISLQLGSEQSEFSTKFKLRWKFSREMVPWSNNSSEETYHNFGKISKHHPKLTSHQISTLVWDKYCVNLPC